MPAYSVSNPQGRGGAESGSQRRGSTSRHWRLTGSLPPEVAALTACPQSTGAGACITECPRRREHARHQLERPDPAGKLSRPSMRADHV